MLQAVAQNSQELLLQLKRSQQGAKQPEISLMPRFSMNHPLELRRKNLSQGRCPWALGRVRVVAVPGSVPEHGAVVAEGGIRVSPLPWSGAPGPEEMSVPSQVTREEGDSQVLGAGGITLVPHCTSLSVSSLLNFHSCQSNFV